ncbi:MAG: Holliday junction resolvase RuvX [Acidimicrobiales bacterium]
MTAPVAVAIPAPGRVLGVDLGAVRVGVAISDSAQRLATGVTVIARAPDRAPGHRQLGELVAQYGAVGVVVGLPRSLSGAIGPAAQGVLDEVAQLRAALAVPVETVDERLTTVAATSALRAGGQRGRHHRVVVDQVAAAVLLQGWLDRRGNETGSRTG